MTVTVLLFASLADAAGAREMSLELPDAATVAAAMDELVAQYPAVAAMRDRLAFAVNETYVKSDQPLADGDELALIPPVSGG